MHSLITPIVANHVIAEHAQAARTRRATRYAKRTGWRRRP